MARSQKQHLRQNIVPQLAETNVHTSGYLDKMQQDELPAGSATVGSFNFVLDKDGKWTTRAGTKYLGTKSVDTGGCTSVAKIARRDGVEIPVVFYGTKSKILHPDTLDWTILESTYTTGLIFGKAMGEKTTDNVNKLIFGNGTDSYRIWDGITGTVSSVTATTIVLTGATTLANRGFTATGSISDKGVAYAYTGLSGSTFTGVTPNPVGLVLANDAIASLPIANAGLPVGNVFTSYSGRIVMFQKPAAAVFGGGSIVGSKQGLYDDFTFSSPRVASEGYQLMMQEGGGSGTAMVQFEGGIACFKQNAVSLHYTSQDQSDYPVIKPLLPYDDTLSGHVGNVSVKGTAFALKNQIFFVSPRKVINSLQRVQNVDYPQALPFSDRIQNTCDGMTWDTLSCGVGYNYLAIFCGKANKTDLVANKILIYDQRFDAWWTPITGIEASSFFVYGGDLYATLGNSPDVVKLFTGANDYATGAIVGNPINATLVLERQNYGKKSEQKKSQRLWLEGWMSKSGTATVSLSFNENGAVYVGTLKGTQDQFFFDLGVGGTFGLEGFGAETFGGIWQPTSNLPDGVGHFRILFNHPPTSFFNIQLAISTSSYFKLLSSAPDTHISNVGIAPSIKASLPT